MVYSGINNSKSSHGCYARALIIGPIGILLILFCIGLLGGISGYSEGSRIGIVDKFSKKGLFFKTWEGEMPLSGMESNGNGMVARVFYFSVTDPEVAGDIRDAMEQGQRVKLVYEEYFLRDQTQMGSSYEIVKVIPIEKKESGQ